jgi:hypothetical protein
MIRKKNFLARFLRTAKTIISDHERAEGIAALITINIVWVIHSKYIHGA